ncbi:MAG: hypothetical protein J5667_03185 [Bacteroidales bacterium]|nr:hypothetical protein [Bacteroidales bacterium]
MKKVLYSLAFMAICSCTPTPLNNNGDPKPQFYISAEKTAWKSAHETKATDTLTISNDIPWEIGEKVLLLMSDQSYEGCTIHTIDSTYNKDTGGYDISEGWQTPRPEKKTICTVYKADGLKSVLIPDAPLEEGTYRAFYPYSEASDETDGKWYDMMHLSFYSPSKVALEYNSQKIVISDPVTYKTGDSLNFVLNHFLSLIDIDIYPPKTGSYHRQLFLASQTTVFPGKIDYWIDEEHNKPDDYRGVGWMNFTALNPKTERKLEEGIKFQTATGILPLPFEDAPVCVHLFYRDGTHYVSEPFALPSLSIGVETKLVAKNFSQTDEPLQGASGSSFHGPIEEEFPDWLFQ